jgi:hypothetical protein
MILLIGVISALSGLAAATYLQQDRCLDAGGRWNTAARACDLASGATMGWSVIAIVAGLVVAVAVGVILFRAMLFVTGRAGPPRA